MKMFFSVLTLTALSFLAIHSSAQPNVPDSSVRKNAVKNLYIDVHHFQPGTVKFEDVAKAHTKDLAVEGKYGVDFIKFWVDESEGLVYCLSSSADSESIRKTHAEAHGLLPAQISQVTNGTEGATEGQKDFFLDIHQLGAGKVTAKDVAAAHKKDLEVQQKYGVNFINYWVDEKAGQIMCLSQAKDAASIIQTHKEAHGLVPFKVMKVKQGE